MDQQGAKAIELYETIAARLEAEGHAPHQLKAYRDVLELMKTCSTIDEQMIKIKNSPFYTAVGEALVADKLEAWKQAMETLGYEDAAQILEEKIKEIEINPTRAYSTGYEQKVMACVTRHSNIRSSLLEMAKSYMSATTMDPSDALSQNEIDTIRRNYQNLENYNITFFQAVSDGRYTEGLGMTEQGLEKFTADIPKIVKGTWSAEDAYAPENIEEAWKELQARKTELKAVAEREVAKTKRAVVIAVPPADSRGTYKYAALREEEL
ncbi:MAG: hypothetical protein MJ092_02335 [Lachnospiraceae bacterium]|nr:hypothetical protein [Lachnospiraceae bacterium]